jgi:two-component system response regulator YesN
MEEKGMKAYIVEDDESMRFILKRFLKRNFPIINIVGESETAEKALEELPTFEADVVLVDISLPGMNGIELIQQLKPNCHNVCILVVTGHEVALYKQQAYGAGAFGIVSKSEFTELLEYVNTLLDIRRHGGCE